MNKLLLAVASAIAIIFVWISASYADGHCEKYAGLKGKAWVDGDCMETPLGENGGRILFGVLMIKRAQLIGIKNLKL